MTSSRSVSPESSLSDLFLSIPTPLQHPYYSSYTIFYNKSMIFYILPESVKVIFWKTLKICMKSGVSDILGYMIFCTHWVQIQTPKFLLKKQCLSAFQPYFTIWTSRIQVLIRVFERVNFLWTFFQLGMKFDFFQSKLQLMWLNTLLKSSK